MPTGRPRTKRYNSEYKSHYKKFDSRRPNTVKGELTRSIIHQDAQSISSTPRAGLQSMQLGIIHEPPIQRKRIVPYEKNHNIFPTGTIKELPDREWLDVDKSSRTDRGVPPTRYKQSHSKVKTTNVPHRTESPILAAEKKLIRNTAERPSGYPYVPDGVKRRTTYDQDFGVNGRKSKTTNRNKVEKSPIRDKKTTKLAIGGKKTGITPDRMAPAGIRTMTSIGDKRLIQPSDNSEYLRSPERENARVFDSEYSSRFKYIDGAWIESPEYQGRLSPVKNKLDWYNEAITRRNEAYGYAKQARGTHFSREELDHQNRINARYDDREDSVSSVSETSVSHSSKKNKRTNGNARKERRSENRMGESSDKGDRPPPPRREAWVKRPASPVESNRSFSTSYSGTTDTTADQFFLERGRSPTPELRETGQARRHHYDMTTNILTEKLRKSLTFSDEKKKDHVSGYHRQKVPLSVKSQDGSYQPRHRDDDVMSEVSMASRATTASKTLDKAKERRDNFWQKQNGQYES